MCFEADLSNRPYFGAGFTQRTLLWGWFTQWPVFWGHVSWLISAPTVLPEGDPTPVRQLPRQAHPQGLPGQVQPQEDEEVRGGDGFLRLDGVPPAAMGCKARGSAPYPRVPACPHVPSRLEKEYAAIKNKEMEEQIEIKVRRVKCWHPGAT